MSPKPSTEERKKEPATEQNVPPLLLVAAWFVPGFGHLILKRHVQAAVFAFVVIAAFVTGLLLSGELAIPRRGNPFSYLATAGCLGNGVLYLVAKIFGFGHGNPTATGFNYGNTFLYTAGVLNMLAVLDVSDIFTGRKS
jgi:hypothetical protein